MKSPDFQEKTEVKVIDHGHHLYSKRSVVTAINGKMCTKVIIKQL